MEPQLKGDGRRGKVIRMLVLDMYNYEYFELVTFQGSNDSRGICCLLLPPYTRTGFTDEKVVGAGVLSRVFGFGSGCSVGDFKTICL